MPMSPLPSRDSIDRFFLLTGLWVALHVTVLTGAGAFSTLGVGLWTLATTVSYTFLYLLPAVIPGYLLHWLLQRRGATRTGARFLAFVLIGLTGMVQVLLFADRVIYGMYGFHINGFVVDLVFSPGGIASLGASSSTELTATLVVIGLLAVQATSYYWTTRPVAAQRPLRWAPRARWVLLAILGFAVGERLAYGYSAATHYQPILSASERYPLYLPTTFSDLATRLGIKGEGADDGGVRIKHGGLSYPLLPLRVEPPARPLNIVWLAVESLRFDMLEPAIMPKLWDLSERSLRLENHYSGGNTTQMGIFSMFYGLYGNYWFPMIAARRSPLLMDVLQQQNYQFSLHTSQGFHLPGFQQDRLCANEPGRHARADRRPAGVAARPAEHRRSPRVHRSSRPGQTVHDLHVLRGDARPIHVSRRKASSPGRISKTSTICQPISPRRWCQIKNRYINSAHYVDQQIGRIVTHLREKEVARRNDRHRSRRSRRGIHGSQPPLGTRRRVQPLPDQHHGGVVGTGPESARHPRHHQPSRPTGHR
jgi:membrane-anchored protein YejM (alkaline phosphatase superfamily)